MVNEDGFLLDAWLYNNDKPPKILYPYLVQKRGATERSFDVSISGKSDEYRGISVNEFVESLILCRFPESATVRMKPLNSKGTPGNGWLIRNINFENLAKKLGSLKNDVSIGSWRSDFEKAVRNASTLTLAEIRAKAASYPEKPKQIKLVSVDFVRNPYVVAEVLKRASGYCEKCGSAAPFRRQKDGTPYLEVHHKKMLSRGGLDTVKNAIALCPNCHRECHYGGLGKMST